MFKQLKIYRTPNGKEPLITWLERIKDNVTRARIKARLDRLTVNNYGDCRSVGNGVFELRIHYGAGYRVYFGEYEEYTILLLMGGTKGTQQKDIQKAKLYWRAFEEENHHAKIETSH